MKRPDGRLSAVRGAPVAALLCGGRSRRMGRPKEGLELAGRPLHEWVAATLETLADTRLQAGGEPLPRSGWRLVEDLRSDAGPAAGIESALIAAGGAPLVVSAVDLPFVPAGLLRVALRRVGHGAPACAPRWGGRWHPLCGAYASTALPIVRTRLDAGRRDLEGLLSELRTWPLEGGTLRAFGDPDVLLCNVNRPGDLERAREIAGARG